MTSACTSSRVPVGQLLADETALGADRHDECVLDVLGLHQAQNLRPEILAPVGPADAAASNIAHAQMHGFDPWAVDEDLELRPGQRQVGNPATDRA